MSAWRRLARSVVVVVVRGASCARRTWRLVKHLQLAARHVVEHLPPSHHRLVSRWRPDSSLKNSCRTGRSVGGSKIRCARHPSKLPADDCALLRVSPQYLEAGSYRAAVGLGSSIMAPDRLEEGEFSREVTIVSADFPPSRRLRSSVAKGEVSGAV